MSGDRPNSVQVSDHAVVQYLRRFRGVDIDAVREEIAAKVPNPEQFARFLGGAPAKVRSKGAVLVITTYPVGTKHRSRCRKEKK